MGPTSLAGSAGSGFGSIVQNCDGTLKRHLVHETVGFSRSNPVVLVRTRFIWHELYEMIKSPFEGVYTYCFLWIAGAPKFARQVVVKSGTVV